MGVYDLLISKEDARKGSPLCEFNGFLEDYLQLVPADCADRPFLESLFAIDNDLKVVVNLRMGISKESISNQIIRYKDVFKLANRAVIIPYVIYAKHDDHQKALIIVDDDYIYAKGMYYSLTEPGSEFQAVKNDIVALTKEEDKIKEIYPKLFSSRAGQLQRELDHKYFSDYQSSLEHAKELSQGIHDNLQANLKNSDDKEELIRLAISHWFLIKKFIYVQCMVDKDLLQKNFNGNVKAQRNHAKQNADAIRFISISDLWRNNLSPKEEK